MRPAFNRIRAALPVSGVVLASALSAFGQQSLPAELSPGDWCRILEARAAASGASTVAQYAYFKASNTGVGDRFGYSVAISGTTVVVGAPQERSGAAGVNGEQDDDSLAHAGAVYVFVLEDGWHQQAYLKASNPGEFDFFGLSVDVSGDTLIVGATGEASNAAGVNGNQDDDSLPNAGAAYVFVRTGTSWSQQAYLKASNPDAADYYGVSVAVSGDTAVVGAWREDSDATGIDGDAADNSAESAGAAYVYTRTGTEWSGPTYLKASNTDAEDGFGWAVAASGDTVVVGAWQEQSAATGVNGDEEDDSADRAGAAYVFVSDGTSWTQEAYVKASNTDPNDLFGRSVAISGDTLLVGAVHEGSNATDVNGDQSNNSTTKGAAYVFVRDGTGWSQEAYLKASNWGADFGTSVAVHGDVAVVGDWREQRRGRGVDGDQDTGNLLYAGSAYLFVRTGTDWSQRSYLKAANTNSNYNFGYGVAVQDEIVVVGARGENSGATGVNGNPFQSGVSGSGAAFLYRTDAQELGVRYCSPAVPNDTGLSGVMRIVGHTTLDDDFMTLHATDLAAGSNLGYFIMGTGMNTFIPPGSIGRLCVTPGLQRFLPGTHNTSHLGYGFARIEGTHGPVSGLITPGSTWNFQAWHRQQVPMATSNFTDAISVTFD